MQNAYDIVQTRARAKRITVRRYRKPAASPPRRVQYAPIERIEDHPQFLEEVAREFCGWEPEDYAVSDENLLSDLVDLG
jgi:hypothetical protein